MSTTKGKAPTALTVEASVKTTPAIKQKELSMSNSTDVSAIRAITVPFHGVSLYVVEHESQPVTPMKPIVQAIGLDWKSQHRKVAANEARWGMVNLTTPSAMVEPGLYGQDDHTGQRRSMACIPVRKVAAWLATIEPGKIKDPEVRARVIQYQNECDDALWQYWNEGAAFNPRAFSINPNDELTHDEQDTLRTMLQSAAEKLPKPQRGKFMMQGWSKLKSHFKVAYREIPRGEFSAAVNIVTRHTAEWEVVEEKPAPQYKPLEPGKMIVDRSKLAAIWTDLGRLRNRLDGLGIMESDLPPSWWQGQAISQ